MAGLGEVTQCAAHLLERRRLLLEHHHVAEGEPFHIGTRPAAVLPEREQLRHVGDREAEIAWVLPLFAAADRGRLPEPELVELEVALVPMAAGREVVEDYGSTGLSLRRHPVAFLRKDLRRRGMIDCAELATARDGRRVVVRGMVLVRQKPGSAKGMMFITVEDETGVANLVIWPSLFERQRRLVLLAGMIACRGRVQREGGVVHVVADELLDLSDLLRSVRPRRRLPDAARPGGRGKARRQPGPAGPRWAGQPARPRHLHPGPQARVRHQGADTGLQVRVKARSEQRHRR